MADYGKIGAAFLSPISHTHTLNNDHMRELSNCSTRSGSVSARSSAYARSPIWRLFGPLAILILATSGIWGFASRSDAAPTPISNSPDNNDEPNLIGTNPFPGNLNPSVLETLYGELNVARIDDLQDTRFIHTGSGASVKAAARFTISAAPLGFFPNGTGSFVPVFTMGGNNYAVTGGGVLDPVDTGPSFTLALRFGGTLYNSNPAANVPHPNIIDHLVTYQIVGNSGHPNNAIGAYVLAWEVGGSNTDNDYQDLVYEISGVSPVPEPTSLLLLTVAALLAATIYFRQCRCTRSTCR